MSDANLNNLVSKIAEDSKAKAKTVIDDANAAAKKIIQEKKDAAGAQRDEILQNAKLEAARAKDQIIAGKKLSIRDNKLKAKHDVVTKAFNIALDKLKKLPENEFAAFLERYLLAMDIAGDEEIFLPKRYQNVDINAVNGKLQEAGRKGELTVRKDGKSIDGGFILFRGGIENNNTYESLLDFYRAELESMVAGNLF